MIFVLTRSDNPRTRSLSRIWEVDFLGELSIYWLLFKPERLTTWVNHRFIGQNITSENQFSNIYRSMWASPVSSAIDKLSIYWSIIDRYTIFQDQLSITLDVHAYYLSPIIYRSIVLGQSAVGKLSIICWLQINQSVNLHRFSGSTFNYLSIDTYIAYAYLIRCRVLGALSNWSID